MNEIERVARASLIDELALTIDQFLTHQIERDTLACDLTPSELTELATGVAAIAAMRGEPVGWQPIETASKGDLDLILLWNGKAVTGGAAWNGGWADWMHDWIDPQPTHWMPLPTPPDSGKD